MTIKSLMTNLLLTLTLVASTFTSSYLMAQNHTNEPCGFDEIHKEKLLNDHEYAQKTIDFENYLLKNTSKLKATSTNYKVPVVVHIMSDGTSLTEVSDQEIQDAIYNLNERYRKIPGSLGDGNGVDVTLEFSLAVRDPNGNCTNGIVRYDLSGNPTYVSDGVQRNTAGISDATLKAYSYWNSTQYYNIWLVSQIDGNNGGSGIQGYAYFASAHGATFDGALILASKFKLSNNTTTTHEIGHAFNLHHTFNGDNDGNSCPLNNNCSSDGDLVCDTPPHIRSGSDCVSGTNSCDGGSSNDLYIHNYMDYSSDACQSEFTAGQATRVIAAMTTTRNSFLETNGNMSLVPVASPTIEFTATSNFVCTNSEITLVDRSTCIPNSYVNSNSYSTISHLWTLNNGATIITSSDQNPTINFTVPGSYDVTLSITTSFGTVTNTKSNFIYVGNAPVVTCQPNSVNVGNFWQTVSNVSLNTLNNNSDSYENGGYSDNRCVGSTIVNSGQSYNLSLSLRAYDLDEVVEVYIDYNNDNTLSASEMIYSGFIASATNGNTGVLTSSITIPSNAVTDTPLLMRVIGEAVSISSEERSCTSYYYIGDVEDYTVIINATCNNSTADAGIDASVCSTSTFTTSATAAYGTILWTSSGTGSFDDSTLEDATYTPSAADITNGSVTLTMTVTNTSSCSNATDDLILSITGIPNADAGFDTNICSTSTFTAAATAGNGVILWSSNGSGSFADASVEDAVYTPSAADITASNVTLTMTVSSGGCSDASDNTILTIQSAPTVDAGVDVAICSTSSFNASASSLNGTNLWTTSGDGTFNNSSSEDPIYTPGVNDISTGTVTLTLTVTNSNCSPISDDIILTINSTPTADAGILSDEICEGENYSLNGTSTNGNILWTTSGDGSFNSNSLEDPLYTPGNNDISTNSVVLTMTVSNNGCSDATDNLTLTINNLPSISGGVDYLVCVGDDITLSGSGGESYLWDNGVIDGISFSPTTIGTTTYTLVGTDANNCANSDQINVTVSGIPTADAGIGLTYCSDDIFSISATATNGSILWTTNGAGTFSNTSIEDVTYFPSNTDITSGSITLTLTVSNGVCPDVTSNVVLTINESPVVTLDSFDPICTYTPEIVFTGGLPEGGEYSVDNVLATSFDPSTYGAGIYTISYSYTDGNSCSNTATQNITVGDCAGLTETSLESDVKIFPNPSQGVFKIITDLINYSFEVTDINGKIIQRMNNVNNNVEIDLTLNKSGIYYINIIHEDNIVSHQVSIIK